MISVNSTYTTILSNGGQIEWRITNGANTFTKENIVDGSKIYSVLNKGVSIGNTISAEFDLKLWNVTVDTTNPLVVQFRATDGSSTSSWYTKGTFYIDTLETSPYSDITKITAFDSMLMTEYVYKTHGKWPAVTDLYILNKICSFIGISLESATSTLFTNNPTTLTNSPNIGIDGTTAREMLSYIGALRGGNWRITADNKLQLIILSNAPSDTASIGDAVTDIDAAPVETVKRVKVWVNESDYYAFPDLPLTDHSLNKLTTHSQVYISVRAIELEEEWNAIGGRLIDVHIPFWCDYTAAKALYNQFINKVYYPFSSPKAFVDPKYEVGDGITIKNTTSIIASQSIDINPLASSSVEFEKDSTINSLYPYKAPQRRSTDYKISENRELIMENTAKIEEQTQTLAELPTLILEQSELLMGGYGGYIKFNKLSDGSPSEMLVMDTPDEATATNIIRLNMNGIGFSTDGGSTYSNAWTIDGKLNADFIQGGTLSGITITGNTITGGTISGTQLTSTGTYTSGWTGTTTIYNGTFKSEGTSGSVTDTLWAEGTGIKLQSTENGDTDTIQMFADVVYGTQIKLEQWDGKKTIITPTGITVNGYSTLEIH